MRSVPSTSPQCHMHALHHYYQMGRMYRDRIHTLDVFTPWMYRDSIHTMDVSGPHSHLETDHGLSPARPCHYLSPLVERLCSPSSSAPFRAQNGFTPVLLACGEGRIRMVKALLTSGANVNAKDCMGWLVIDEQGRCIHVQGEMSPPSSHPDLSLRYTGWSRAPHLVHQAAA